MTPKISTPDLAVQRLDSSLSDSPELIGLFISPVMSELTVVRLVLVNLSCNKLVEPFNEIEKK